MAKDSDDEAARISSANADDGSDDSSVDGEKEWDLRARASEHLSSIFDRASANVSKHMEHPKTQQFGSATVMGLLLGNCVYYRWFKMAMLVVGASFVYGLPSTEKMQQALDTVRSGGITEAKNFGKDVIVGCGLTTGIIFSCFTLSNLFLTVLAYLAYAASGL